MQEYGLQTSIFLSLFGLALLGFGLSLFQIGRWLKYYNLVQAKKWYIFHLVTQLPLFLYLIVFGQNFPNWFWVILTLVMAAILLFPYREIQKTILRGDLMDKIITRNIGILTVDEQQKLKNSTVAIAGVGGVGGLTAERLTRLGIGHVKIADPQNFEPTNLNRQFGGTSKTIGQNKARVVGKLLKEINPDLKIEIYPEGLRGNNVGEFVDGSDVVIDGLDQKALKEMLALYPICRKKGLYVITAFAVGFGTTLLIFSPKGMSFEEYFEIPKKENELKQYQMPAEKICPIPPSSISPETIQKIMKEEIFIPTLSLGCSFAASVIATEIISLLLKKKEPIIAPKCVILDFLKKELTIYETKRKINDNNK